MEPHSSQAWALQNLDRSPVIKKVYYTNTMANASTQIVQSLPQIINEKHIEKDATIVDSIATVTPILTPIIVDINGVTIKQDYESIVHRNPEIYTLSNQTTKENIVELENVNTANITYNMSQNQQLTSVESIVDTPSKEEIPHLDDPPLDIVINNVVCCFSTRCHLNLKRIAQEALNAIYKRDCGVTLKFFTIF